MTGTMSHLLTLGVLDCVCWGRLCVRWNACVRCGCMWVWVCVLQPSVIGFRKAENWADIADPRQENISPKEVHPAFFGAEWVRKR
eukprot:m.209421 g.209421  ORF g.209421 m.209421 type:complete len:85 (-) comp18981_c0_seq2:92-346(-)